MRHRFVTCFLLAVLAIAGPLAVAPPSPACGIDGETAQAQAEQAITWAATLVEWHARRRVAAAPDDAVLLTLQAEAEGELAEARADFEGGMYPEALNRARNVQTLLEN